MHVASRTTEGWPCTCPVCGKRMSVAPGTPLGDIICPHCGVLFFPEVFTGFLIPDALQRLSELGVQLETDDEGEVTWIQLNGAAYNDRTVSEIAKLKGIPIIDIRNTEITHEGADRLRTLLPDAAILR